MIDFIAVIFSTGFLVPKGVYKIIKIIILSYHHIFLKLTKTNGAYRESGDPRNMSF